MYQKNKFGELLFNINVNLIYHIKNFNKKINYV